MTDLEMTKLCSAAMGYAEWDDSDDEFIGGIPPPGLCVLDRTAAPIRQVFYYDPLHDDAQTMALLKKFELEVGWYTNGHAAVNFHDPNGPTWIEADTLNRAIVECVAKMKIGRK